MKIAIMQPYFFPYLGYFQLINSVDKFIFYDDVNFIKRGWINRNRILINSQPKYINAGITGASQFKRINEIKLNTDEYWKNKFLKTLSITYGKAPYFYEVFPIMENLMLYPKDLLSEFNIDSIKLIAGYLKIKCKFEISSSFYHEEDLRGVNRIIALCKKNRAKIYINPKGGKNLYNSEEFNSNDIKLYFIRSDDIHYKQFNNKFVPDLSIIDVLMFNGFDKTRELLFKYFLE